MALKTEQATALSKFKSFIAGGAVTKGGKTVTDINYILTLGGELLARGVVVGANAKAPDGTTVEDLPMTWNVTNGVAYGGDIYTLVLVVT